MALSAASYVPQDSYEAVSATARLTLPSPSPPSLPGQHLPSTPLLLLPQAPAKYHFNWAVDDPFSGNNWDVYDPASGNNYPHYTHQEARDGDHTQGYYYVHLPDGRLQKVTYTVQGDSGFVAEVTYEGEAQYPEPGYGAPTRHPAPTYGTPGPH